MTSNFRAPVLVPVCMVSASSLAEASPRLKARIAGFFWLVTFVAGVVALVSANARFAADLIATASYLVVTLLIYGLLKPVNRNLSLLGASVSCVGLAIGVLNRFDLTPFRISPLVFFGFHCLLIGYLILQSTFLPRILGALMAFGGLGWLTFGFPSVAKQLAPFNLAPGMIAEGVLTLWLLVMGVNAERWKEQAGVTGISDSQRVMQA